MYIYVTTYSIVLKTVIPRYGCYFNKHKHAFSVPPPERCECIYLNCCVVVCVNMCYFSGCDCVFISHVIHVLPTPLM